MATSEQTPSPALLRLRPADVVRFCGLNAAAAGLDLAANHSVIASRREGQRLLATVVGEPPRDAWVELAGEGDSARWSCACGHPGPLACVHVAAILSAWIAHPSDFIAHDAHDAHAATPLPAAEPECESASSARDSRSFEPPRTPIRADAAADTTTLEHALARMNVADLEEAARRVLGTELTGGGVLGQARRSLLTALSDPSFLHSLLNRLDSSARTLLSFLDVAGGTVTAADLEALAGRIARPVSAVESDVAVLERHALLLPMLPESAPSQHGPGSSWRHVAGWRIPDEVRRAAAVSLPLDALATQGGTPLGAPLVKRVALRQTRTTPRALYQALALLEYAPPPLGLRRDLATPQSDSRDTPRSAEMLAPGELAPERLKELARTAGFDAGTVRLARRLLMQAREQRTWPFVGDLTRATASERPLVLRATFRRWLGADSAADLLDVSHSGGKDEIQVRYAAAHPAFRPSAIAQEVSDGRRFVTRLLSRARPNTWYSLDDLIELAWQVQPGMLRARQQVWATPVWWLESLHEKRALHPQVRADWLAAEGAFIRSLVAGALKIWGAVDVAASKDDVPAAFRLTPFGTFLLRRDNALPEAEIIALCDADCGPAVLPVRDGALAVQPLAAPPALLEALALWATPTAVSGRRLLYTLSADHACAAFDQHLAPTALPTVLRPLHDRAAATVAHQLNRWHAQWGATRITTGYTLLEASDEATLVEALAAAPEIAARCRRVGHAFALALPEDAAALRGIVARRGFAV